MASLGKYIREVANQSGARQAQAYVAEALADEKITMDDFSLREMAESYLGPNWYAKLDAYRNRMPVGMSPDGEAIFAESGDAVDSSSFSNITGQILFNEIKQKYNAAGFIGDQLCSLVPITNRNLSTQKTPWLSAVVDTPALVNQGMPYPHTEFSEQYIEYPAPVKFGRICSVTMEMIFSDLTMQARESAGTVGLRHRQHKEEMILSTVMGLINSHKWNGTTYNTYQTTTPWVNVISGSTLTDWTSLEAMEQLLAEMTDPVTGKPIEIDAQQLLVMPRKFYTARQILHATEVRKGDGASNTQATYSESPLDTMYPILMSKYAYKLLTSTAAPAGWSNHIGAGSFNATAAKEYCFLGDFQKAFVWRQAMPLEVITAPPMMPEDFHQDIVLQVKTREFGVAGVRDPRYVVKLYNN
jgi:hypothetical protein